MLFRPLALLLALVVSGEELVGGGTLVLTPLNSIVEWRSEFSQISYHGGQGLGESQDRAKIKDLDP